MTYNFSGFLRFSATAHISAVNRVKMAGYRPRHKIFSVKSTF